AILELIDRITFSMDHNHTPTSIFLDLTKAFDCLDHQILIQKLKHYKLHDTALQLCTNYFTNRKQYTTLKDTKSNIQ
ncbi:hypothetical protein CAPTEDRAFT_31091, partial [Capitella teleta]